MAEDYGEVNQGRRNFLKKVAVVGAAGAGIALGGVGINAEEKNTVENGISTEHGAFFPLYETHYKGIDAEGMPDDLDVLFTEAVGSDLLVASTRSMFADNLSSYENNKAQSKLIQDSVLKKIVTNGTEVMVGDVDPRIIPGFQDPTSIDFFAGIGLGLLTLKVSLEKTKKNDHITRRKFLKIAGVSGSAWLMGSGAYFLTRGGPWIGKFDTERNDALHRIVDRLNGLQSSTHPEQLMVFFRNLIMADKMSAVAEDIEEKTGKKARVGFVVEYGHNGIQDFLRIGHNMCRWIISQYPKPILRSIADINGGKESLWTARLFKFPKDFSLDPNADWSKVGDRKVVDVELQKALESKLG